MKNKIRRMIAMLLVFCIVSSMWCGTVSATEVRTESNEVAEGTIKSGTASQMLVDRVNTMASRTGESLTVAEVKELNDFAGNIYYLVEYAPTGYMICHAEYGNIIEYSTSAPSPYADYDGELYYGGPTYFYQAVAGGLAHTYMEETISTSDKETMAMFESASEQMNVSQADCIEYAVTTKQESLDEISLTLSSLASTQQQRGMTPTGTITYVGSYSAGLKMKNLTTEEQIGYYVPDNSNGVCGYIASGLMLYWIDECAGSDLFINDFSHIRGDHNGFIGDSLSRELRSYGSQDASDAGGFIDESLKAVVNHYADRHYLTISTAAHALPVSTFIRNKLIANNKPVIVTGKLTKNNTTYQFHAVLAYGYTSNYEVVVHYGHAGYSNIVLNYDGGLYNTCLELKNYSAQTININDIPSSNWAYNAASYCVRYRMFPLMVSGDFNPNNQISRGYFVQALYTLAGMPESTGNNLNGFTDAPIKGTDLYKAADWAVEKGILTGVNATTLALGQNLTREQAITFLYRTSNVLGCSFSDITGPYANAFSDYNSVGDFARVPMHWATTRYLVNGDSHNNLNPQRLLMRSEAAQLIYKLSIYATR